MKQWVVSETESGLKLIAFLKQKLPSNYSARKIKRLLESNSCEVNGSIERFASIKLSVGDRVLFKEVIEQRLGSVQTIYEDDQIFVCHKPCGLTAEDIQKQFNTFFLVHRLDKDTSGVLVLAKTKQAFQDLCAQFKKRIVKKTYLAIVDGTPVESKGFLENTLGVIHVKSGQKLRGVLHTKKGKTAITEWKLLQRGKCASLFECNPITGRTHQIRIQLEHIGHPILGDRLYGRRFKCLIRPSRCMLHAYKIAFKYPETKHDVFYTAQIPKDFKNVLRKIGCDANLKSTA